jgi:hypothetical protein
VARPDLVALPVQALLDDKTVHCGVLR